MTKLYKGLTHVGDALVITVSALLAAIVFAVTMVFDVMRYAVHARAH